MVRLIMTASTYIHSPIILLFMVITSLRDKINSNKLGINLFTLSKLKLVCSAYILFRDSLTSYKIVFSLEAAWRSFPCINPELGMR